ncbi:WRKY transcription factor SUSIBA2-like [Arachis stenosperma]|uniref:WRKY transcription factor SUSIBA2-like n=1 Tax=Arachis stenosperma TaxID=217475 RepID=UPI0025AC4ACA|nr:WRKY transcription factor SUSIBA2-like [Arachis stenosperma]
MEDDNHRNSIDNKNMNTTTTANNNNNVSSNNCSDSKNMDSDLKGGVFPAFPAKRSIAERRGFNSNAARINTARFRTNTITTSPLASPSPSSCSASPCITIPPGISPTALLDSPIMLPNSQAMPSPTTGSFHWLSSLPLDQGNLDDAPDSSLKFKNNATLADPNPLPPYSASLNQVSSNWHLVKGGNTDCQSIVPVLPPIDFSFPEDFSKGQNAKSIESRSFNDVKMVNCSLVNVNKAEMMQISRSDEAGDESTLPKNVTLGGDIGRQPVMEKDQKETLLTTGVVRTSEDGYNWRKYGQKQVKGSEYPRSYYKCTQPNCQVKKKVERSHDGQITEIIYKGTHNHSKPHLGRRASGLSTDEMSDMGEAGENYAKLEGSGWKNVQPGVKDTKHGLDWKADGLERTSSTSVVTELSDPMSTNKGKPLCAFEAEDTPEHSSTLASNDGDEDGTTQALAPAEDDAEDDESDSKRRKKENYLVESTLPSRAVREPRVVVQIETEIDILDDGYRWRKYGQKVVKGNPNPRSYYKCTSAGCPVRKHVERASHNTKYVITTYEGKHNHEVPTARTNNHVSSNDGGLPPSGPNGQSALALPGSAVIPKSENHQTLTSHFDRKPEFGSDFLRPSLVGAFSNNLKFGSSPMCQMKYPSLSSTMSYGSFGLNPDRCTAPQAGSIPSVYPDFPMPLPLNLPSSGNFSLAGLNFNCAKPMNPVQPFLSGQQVKDIDTGFLRPKQEQKDDAIYGTCLPPVDHGNSSSAAPSSIYQQVMQNFPS